MTIIRDAVSGWMSWALAALFVLALAGCGGGGGGQATAINMPPAPLRGATPLDPFYVATTNYFNRYTSSTAPFSPSSQLADQHYPVSMSYQAQVAAPTGFQLPQESELAVMTWAQADPRLCAVSGVSPDTARVQVMLVDTIVYGNYANIIGLTKLISGGGNPRFEVYLTTKEPITGSPMTVGEIDRTLVHELGHVFGLGHSPDERDLMYYRSNAQQGVTRQTYLTYGDAITLWTTLNNRRVNWYPDRPTITQASQTVTPAPTGRTARVTDTGGEVVCVYTRPE